jgi:hypothetical protein
MTARLPKALTTSPRQWLLPLGLFLLPTLAARTAEHGALTGSVLLTSLGFAALYTVLCITLHRYSLWKLTLSWVGLPFLLFSLFWLRWLWAVPLTLLWGVALWRTAQAELPLSPTPPLQQGFTVPHWGGYLLILMWVYLCGAGGHGLQKEDYILHNSRLVDLMDISWPVHYNFGRWIADPAFGPDFSLLVVYCAYFLPAAAVGKAFGHLAGFETIHLWTLTGCWLAYRWVIQLSGTRFTTLAAVAFIFFAGWDSVIEWKSVVATIQHVAALDVWHWPFDWEAFQPHIPLLEPNFLDFWPTGYFHVEYFMGHFVSHSASLFWAPHQTIGSWLIIALLAQAWLQQQDRYFYLIYALLTLWSPMNMMALVLFPIAFLLRDGWHSILRSLSWENAIAGSSLLVVFSLYYTSGSALTNPGAGFLWENPQLQIQWVIIFHIVTWGIYALAIALSGIALPGNVLNKKQWLLFSVLCTSLLALPLFRYGEYSDLVTRGSTSLMFLLMVLYLKTIQQWWIVGRKNIAILLLCLLIPGAGSGLLSITSSLLRYNERNPGVSVAYYGEGWLFMGSTKSPFARWLAE